MNDLILQEKVLKNKSVQLWFTLVFTTFFSPLIIILALSFLFPGPSEENWAIINQQPLIVIFIAFMFLVSIIQSISQLLFTIKSLSSIQVLPSGLLIKSLQKEGKMVYWEEIKKISPVTASRRTRGIVIGPKQRLLIWRVGTSIEPKFSLGRKRYFFHITDGHESYRELLALITEKTGMSEQ